jgi:hypothetical protein
MPDQFFMKSYLSLPEIFGVQTDKPGVKTYTSINSIWKKTATTKTKGP